MKFEDIKHAVENQLKQMMANENYLFVTEANGYSIWEKYLNTIPPEENKIYKIRREYDCSFCRQFVYKVGNVVSIHDGVITSIWDCTNPGDEWHDICKALSDYVKSFPIKSIFLTELGKTGLDHNYTPDGMWSHFYISFDRKFKKKKDDVNTIISENNSRVKVFKRALDEFSVDTINEVVELINQGSIYRGSEYSMAVNSFLNLKKKYNKLSEKGKELFAWEKGVSIISTSITNIRNTAIGTLMIDLSEGTDLNSAVDKYEKLVAPSNYKRSKPIYTEKMLKQAKDTITSLGYLDSLNRRFATADDITINNILYINRDTAKRVDANLFDDMLKSVTHNPKTFDRVADISIDNFIENVLPTANEVYAYFENRHATNLASLITSSNKDAKSMFKWNNNFSWAYSGNVTDSIIKKNVEKAGGDVNGVLRFSIQWNDDDSWNMNDEDAHCIEPNGNEIYYGDRRSYLSNGVLDVDIQHPHKGIPAVENITWPSIKHMLPGRYRFFVHTYCARGGRGGFRAEIEFNGVTYSYDYSADTIDNQTVYIADVRLNEDDTFEIKHYIPHESSNKTIWGISTNNFVPVSMILYSPNYWDNKNGYGNKHYMFMLKDCVNPEKPNGFYNEFLNSELYPAHRKVMEALGSRVHVEDSDDQLSGLGFSSTLRNSLVVKVKGATQRIMRIQF